MEKLYRVLVAKNDTSESTWLPLWVHCFDTYNVMKYLLSQWRNNGALHAITKNQSEETMHNVALFLALFHDLGKASMAFQTRIADGCTELWMRLDTAGLTVPSISDTNLRLSREVPHSVAGEIMLLMNRCPASLAAIVGAHHGKPWEKGPEIKLDIEEYLENGKQAIYSELDYGLCIWGDKKRRDVWLDAQKSFLEWAMGVLSLESLELLPEIGDFEAVILSGFVVMADWLASNKNYFPLIPIDQLEPENLDERKANLEKKIKLPPSWHPSCNVDFRALSVERFGFLPNEVQAATIKAVLDSLEPGLIILEAPMGIGKTEAALLAAEEYNSVRVGGVLFALPTQATANGIFPRVLDWGNRQTDQNTLSIRLAHGMAMMNEEYASLIEHGKHAECTVDDYENNRLVVHDFFQGSKQALLADFVVSTVDQVLLASLKQKHFMLRHLGLSGKVVIIDECHAYDAYMNEYLERTLEWLGRYRTPVIMLSATLPYKRRAAFIDAYLGNWKNDGNDDWRNSKDYPLLTWTDEKQVRQKVIPYSGTRYDVAIVKMNAEPFSDETREVLNILREQLCDGGCAAVILNTVKRAQKMAEVVGSAFPEKNVILLHSRFVVEDRLDAENSLISHMGKKSVKKDRDGYVVIGTQVIEQSLDFDADIMITDLCPMDLLLQRIGRLHRHTVHDENRPVLLKAAKCYVLGCGQTLDKGSEAVYGSYLLTRTVMMLPDQLALPDDISGLVQNVYDDTVALQTEPEGYRRAEREFQEKRNKDKKDADAFRIIRPGRERTINRFLDAAILTDEEEAKAQVRNGDMSIEVIALFKCGDKITRTPWRYKDAFDENICPDDAICRSISNQRLSLPSWIGGLLNLEDLLMPKTWSESVWLRGKKLLLFDENGDAMFERVRVSYDKNYGLCVERRNNY